MQHIKKDLGKNMPLLLFFLFFILPMLDKKGIVVVLVVLGIVFAVKRFKNNLGKLNLSQKDKKGPIDLGKINFMNDIKKNVVGGVIAVLVILLFSASVVIIEVGETGVYSLFGKIKDEELSSGFHLVIPFARVTIMSIQDEEYTMSIAQGEGKIDGADAISSLTKEGLSVDLDMTVLYQIEEAKASDVYRELGVNYEDKIIRPTIRTVIRDVVAQYDAKDIYSDKRQEVAEKISENLKNVLSERGLIIKNVLLRNVNLPSGLTQSIQEKLQAEQESQKYEFILEKESKEKERKIIEAEGQMEAQKIINQSLTTNYLYYLYVNQLKDREGTIYVPTGTTSGMPLFRNLGQ